MPRPIHGAYRPRRQRSHHRDPLWASSHGEDTRMSHIVEIETQVRDPVAIQAACQRLKLRPPVEGRHQLFSDEVAGLGVQLPGWQYLAVCDTTTGQLRYDNFGGRWG